MADRLRSFCTQELYTRKEDQKEANQFESLTIDNDISFQKHKELSKLIEANIFFCHPQSPHEKGSVENRNKAVRRYIKKKSDLSSYPQEMLSFVENRLRDKYMKCLQYKTPREAFMEEMQKINTKKSTTCGIIESKLLTESVRIEGLMCGNFQVQLYTQLVYLSIDDGNNFYGIIKSDDYQIV